MKYIKYKHKNQAKGQLHAAALEAGGGSLYPEGVNVTDEGLAEFSNAEAKKSKIKDEEFSDTITKAKQPKVAKFKTKKK